jgi:hypothetical protein
MNSLRIWRNNQAITQAMAMKAIVSSSLWKLCEVAPISVTPNTRAPSTWAAAALLLCTGCVLFRRSAMPCCTAAQPERQRNGSVTRAAASP